MMTCADPSCVNTKSESFIDCSSPFCSRQFHLSCAKLKGKKKSEINNIYFLFNSCNEFIKKSSGAVESKLTCLKNISDNILQPIHTKLAKIETDFHASIESLTEKMRNLENFKVGQQTSNKNSFNRIDKLEAMVIENNVINVKTNEQQFRNF